MGALTNEHFAAFAFSRGFLCAHPWAWSRKTSSPPSRAECTKGRRKNQPRATPAGPGPEIRGTRTEVSKSLTRPANLRPLTAARTETPKTPTKHQPPPAPRKKRRAQRALSRPGPGASHKLAFDSVTVGDQRANPRNPQPRRREAVTAVAVAAVIALATLLSYAVGVVARHILRVVVHQR